MRLLLLATASLLLAVPPLRAANFLDKLFQRDKSALAAALSSEEISSGLKEALSRGVQHAVTNLGRADGFLSDAQVKIPLPENLRTIESAMRKLGQNQLADDFILTMNRAAEKAVPEAAAVLGDSVKQMTLADARSILTGTNTAATDYFRRTSRTNLHTRFLPIVQQATASTGATAAYKRFTGNLGGSSGLASLGSSLLGRPAALDIDEYVTGKALDGLFLKIADQEKLIRENPAARSTELLQKVFGAVKK